MRTEPRQTQQTVPVAEIAARAKIAASQLALLNAQQRSTALLAIAQKLQNSFDQIREANDQDLKNAEQLMANGQISKSLVGRLKLDAAKLASLIEGIKHLASLPDPIGTTNWGMELDDGLTLYRINCPIGVIGVIFESRPDALPQIASLCVKTANAVILKGGSEALTTNRLLYELIKEALIESNMPADSIALLESREAVDELLEAEGSVDLIIPRGSKQLVRRIQSNTRIPVLGHADGVCHVYIDKAADEDKALKVVEDSKVQYPSACNSAETILIHSEVAPAMLPKIVKRLLEHKVDVRVDERCDAYVEGLKTARATDLDWITEYCDLIVSIRIIDSLEDAINHINKYGSQHTDAIVTEDKTTFDQFFASVNSAGIFLNASTRFADGYRYGFGAEVGVSTGKLHPRGPVGLDGLITYKYKLLGSGHVVKDYTGQDAKGFTHKPII
jgi:glutamate-5-semialdehyde dehydrogenase